MNKSMLLFVLVIIGMLSGCVSKEAKQFIQTNEFKSQVEEIIIEKGLKEYDLELKVDTDNSKFEFENALPIKTEDRVSIPVVTTDEPTFRFDATAHLEHKNGEAIRLTDVDIETRGLGNLGEVLLTDLFKRAYEEEFKNLVSTDDKARIESIKVLAKRSTSIEDENEERELAFALSADYKEGRFKDIGEIEEMMNKHMFDKIPYQEDRIYLPEIEIELYDTIKQDVSNGERFNNFIEKIKANTNLPDGLYFVHYRPESENEENFLEYVRVERHR